MEERVPHAITHFGARFFKEADSGETDSTACSPLSAQIILAMLALGCKDKSNHEILKNLNFPDDDALRSAFSHISSKLKSFKGANTFTVANKIYVRRTRDLKPVMKKDAVEVFDCSLEYVNFSRPSVSRVIQEWVEKTTNVWMDFRRYLDLDLDTHVVLINVINFVGVWETPFDTRLDVANFPFHASEGVIIPITVMKTTGKRFRHGFSQEMNSRLLQIRFEGGEASMIIVLPEEIEGLELIMESLASGHDIMADVETLRTTELDVTLPRFEGESFVSIDLVTVLTKMGIISVFDEQRSELNMFTDDRNLLGSDAAQDTAIITAESKVTWENGAWSDESGSSFRPQFVADRAFFFLILVQGLPIFMGTFRGRLCEESALNYSCNYLNRSFSLSVNTFYSRYDNRVELIILRQLLETHASEVKRAAHAENRANMRKESRSRS